MSMRAQSRILVTAAVVVALCLAMLSRYAYYALQGAAMYKVDRWTGRVWFITPEEIRPVPHTRDLADLTRE